MKRLSVGLEWCVAGTVLALGTADCYIGRYQITSDGVSYAELADRYVAGLWSQTVNAHWSRLYPFLLSLPMRVFHPTRYTEYIYFHIVNLALFAVALLAFRGLLGEILRWQTIESTELSTLTWSPRQFLLIGYALFAYIMRMIPLGYVTPDIGVAAVSIAATALILRMTRSPRSDWSAAGLGLILGAGYLLKSIIMIVWIACILTVAFLLRGNDRLRNIGILSLMFLAIAAPNIIELSKQQGKITFSESGRLVQMWHIDGTSFVHLDPRGNVRGIPKHPPHQIYEHPNAYEFAAPITATYSPWFDPAYWHQGLSPVLDLEGQLNALKITGRYYATALLLRKGPLLFLLIILLVEQYRSRVQLRRKWALWLVPSLVPLASYAILFADDRYVGGFVLIVFILILGSIQLRNTDETRRLFSMATIVVAVSLFAWMVATTLRDARHPGRNVEKEIAEGIVRNHYFSANDPVACIGYCFDYYWARLAYLRITAEVPAQITAANSAKGPVKTSLPTDADEFWLADQHTRELVLNALAKTGAKGVVAVRPPSNADLQGWTRIEATDFYVRAFRD